VGQGIFLFWLQSEGRINSGWYISEGNHSHLLKRDFDAKEKNPNIEQGIGTLIVLVLKKIDLNCKVV
jgi:hypothetical protein